METQYWCLFLLNFCLLPSLPPSLPPSTNLYQALLEEYLRSFLEDGQESGMVDAYPSLEEGENMLHLWQLLVFLGETVNGV